MPLRTISTRLRIAERRLAVEVPWRSRVITCAGGAASDWPPAVGSRTLPAVRRQLPFDLARNTSADPRHCRRQGRALRSRIRIAS